MIEQIKKLFEERQTREKIQHKLPMLFHIAELESSRANRVGMEVGSMREKIIIALLMYKYGEDNVVTGKITEPEEDVKLFNNSISIKTGTGKYIGSTKLIWTVDESKSHEFREMYNPTCDMIYVHINWGDDGGFYFIPRTTQQEALSKLGREAYIKLPKPGTNPRGVEMTAEAMRENINHKSTLKLVINWKKEKINFKPYKRWVELWQEN